MTVADRDIVDAHHRKHEVGGAGEERFARRLGLGDAEGPLDQAQPFAVEQRDQAEPRDAVQDAGIGLARHHFTGTGEVVTRQADTSILNGITRLSLIALLDGEGLRLVERPFSVAEAKAAREAFLTSTTNFVLPVVRIDDVPIGNGHPGTAVRRLREAYLSYTAAQGMRR